MLIFNNIDLEARNIINEIQLELGYNFKDLIVDYLSRLLIKSMKNKVIFPELSGSNIIDLYDLAEYNLISCSIFPNGKAEIEIFRHLSYEVYLKIFEVYEDEISFEICSNLEKVETVLNSLQYHNIRFDITKLLDKVEHDSPYVRARLLKLKYLDLRYSEDF
jgi:hypothetical protein